MKLLRGLSASSVTRGAVYISFFGVVSKLLGVVRDRLLTSTFGAGDVVDAYVAAFRLPDIAFNTLVLGALSAAFVPVFIQYSSHKENKKAAFELAATVLNVLVSVTIVCAALGAIFAPWLVPLLVPGFSGEKLDMTISLTRVMLWAMVLFSASNIFGGVLNAQKKFFVYAVAPVVYNLGIIFGILYLVQYFGYIGMALGVVVGAAAHCIVQGIAAVKSGFRFGRRWSIRDEGVRTIGKLMVPRTLALAVQQVSDLIVTVASSLLAAGSVTVQYLANNIAMVPVSLIGVPMSASVYPDLCIAVNEKRWRDFRTTLLSTHQRILFGSLFLTVLFFILRAQIVRILYGAGAFDWADTVATLETLSAYLISLFALSTIPLLTRALYAQQDTKTPLYISLLSISVSIAGVCIATPIWGVVGIAAAVSFASIIQWTLLVFVLNRRVENMIAPMVFGFARMAALACAAGIVAYISLYAIEPVVGTATGIGVFLQAVVATVAGSTAFFGPAWLLRFPELRKS